MKNDTFFELENYIIDEMVIPFRFHNSYQIFNDKKENVGSIKQKFTRTQKILGIIFGKNTLPLLLEVRSANGALEASVSRNWIFFMSKIIIRDSKGKKIGSIAPNFNLFKATYKILNDSNIAIAQISGNWKEWSFEISDSLGNKCASLARRVGTSSNRYNVAFVDDYLNTEEKVAILTSAITFGMV